MAADDVVMEADRDTSIDLSFYPPREEPIFELDGTCNWYLRTEEGRAEALQQIRADNSRWIVNRLSQDFRPFHFTSDATVITAHRLCGYFGLSDATKALALDIFDRFCIKLVQTVVNAINQVEQDQKQEQLNAVMTRLADQCLLRLLSSLQIASKINDRDTALTPQIIKRYLNRSGRRYYSVRTILRSESRLCSTLNHRLISFTTYHAVESLLGLRRSPCLLAAAPQVFAVAVQIMNITYLCHEALYQQLCEMLKFTSQDEKLQAECDALWAGASLIIAALHFINFDLQELAVQELAADLHNERTEFELRSFSWLLWSMFLNEMPNLSGEE